MHMLSVNLDGYFCVHASAVCVAHQIRLWTVQFYKHKKKIRKLLAWCNVYCSMLSLPCYFLMITKYAFSVAPCDWYVFPVKWVRVISIYNMKSLTFNLSGACISGILKTIWRVNRWDDRILLTLNVYGRWIW